MTFCEMLANVNEALPQVAGHSTWYHGQVFVYNVHAFLYQSPNSVVSRTVSRTQIWRDKVRCFLTMQLDYFTSRVTSQRVISVAAI